MRVGMLADAFNLECTPHNWGNPTDLAVHFHLELAMPNAYWFEMPHPATAVDRPYQPKFRIDQGWIRARSHGAGPGLSYRSRCARQDHEEDRPLGRKETIPWRIILGVPGRRAFLRTLGGGAIGLALAGAGRSAGTKPLRGVFPIGQTPIDESGAARSGMPSERSQILQPLQGPRLRLAADRQRLDHSLRKGEAGRRGSHPGRRQGRRDGARHRRAG